MQGVYGEGLGIGGPVYYACLWVALIACTTVARHAAALGPRVIWGSIAIAVLAFALAPPLLSQDAFSYISYARMSELHGANPYETAPVALPGDATLPYVGWTMAQSAYGPGFSLAALPLGWVGVPAAFWSLKVAMAICVLGLAALTAAVAARRGVEPLGASAIVALNPVVLVHVVGGAHNDALMMLLAMGAVLVLAMQRELLAGAGFALAAAVKVSGAVAAPFALAGSRHRGAFVAGAALAAAGLGAAVMPLFGISAFGSLAVLGDNQGLSTRLSVPRIASHLPLISLEAARVAALFAYGLLLVWLLAWTRRTPGGGTGGGDWLRAAGWATLGLLLATSWILPWYLLWLLPLAAVAKDRPLLLATLALCGLQLAYGIPA